eukprot:4284694-Pyramimonas_sp.AAC.1
MFRAFEQRGVSSQLLAVFSRELSDLSGSMAIQGACAKESFEFNRGGRQGGVEMPDSFDVYLEVALEDVVAAWRQKGWGFAIDGAL